MAWITPTENDILTRISGDELETFRSANLSDGQDDPVARTIVIVVNRVRGAIQACPNNSLDDAGTIPDTLLDLWLDLVVWAIMLRAGAVISNEIYETRKTAMEQARDLLKEIASCDYPVEQPDGATNVPGSGAEATYPDRQATRDKLNGL